METRVNIPRSIGLVDFSHLLVVNFKSMGKSQGPNDAENQTMKQLAEIRNACERVVVCLDSKPYKRSEIYPPYKAQREREPELVAMWKRCVERLELDGYQTARAPGAEADDVIATLAAHYEYFNDSGCRDVRIYGTDKDCLQCVNESVRCFSYKGNGEWEIRDEAWVRSKWEVAPTDMALMLAICGDTSDNIPGIQGLGQKTAAKLINAYKNPEGIAVAMTAAVEAAKITGKLPSFWEKYAKGCASLPLWLRLTTLDHQAELEKHPLKYLEQLEMKPLVITGQTDVQIEEMDLIDVDPDWDQVERETAERERAELAAALPVEPPKPEPRIGKDPNADEHLKRAAEERKRERDPAVVAADNAKEAPRVRPDGRTQGQALEDARLDRHGQERPKAQNAHGAASSGPPAAGSVGANPKDPVAQQPTAHAGPVATGAAEVVPRSQGPQPEKMSMVVVPPPSWELATQPRSPSEMAIVANRFWNSRFYQAHNNENGTFAVIALGRELGLGAAASVEGFHIVNNRPFPKATMLKALAERHPDCEWIMITSADDKHATIKTKHRKIPEVLEYTYTIERAATAGYLTGSNRENWKTKPQEMLEARATSKGVRRWYPGATFGMHSVEEAGDD